MRSFYGLGATGGHDASRISDPIANSVSRYLSVHIENLFAICFAAVVQGGILLASAYLFHFLLKNRSQKIETTGSRWLPYFVSTILLLLLPISIVFSYGARLEWQIGPEQKGTIQASGAYSDATSMMNTLKGMIAEERQRLATNINRRPRVQELDGQYGPAFKGCGARSRGDALISSLSKTCRQINGRPNEADKPVRTNKRLNSSTKQIK